MIKIFMTFGKLLLTKLFIKNEERMITE